MWVKIGMHMHKKNLILSRNYFPNHLSSKLSLSINTKNNPNEVSIPPFCGPPAIGIQQYMIPGSVLMAIAIAKSNFHEFV